MTTHQTSSKKSKIAYWISTIFIFLFEGVMPALTFNTPLAIEGISHLGYPDYFRIMLTVFNVLGALGLVLPNIPARFKEWAYTGFGIVFISAFVSHGSVDGWTNPMTFFPAVVFLILIISYLSYHKLNKKN
ncbi:DoxX family protein [Candidatus Peregrinibacteria bacterium]|nr:DoxX family protein [Candidatus Peregrinibacteria bacterium]